MGMTDNQFKAYRQRELHAYETMREQAKIDCPDSPLMRMIEQEIAYAKADIER